MDIHMPVMDGVEAIKRIRADDAAWSAVPVVALTADAMAGAKERYIEMGMTGYVAKPIDQGELFAAILAALFAQTTRDVAA
jgi:CheY-like chemotaxis protein